MKCDPIPDSDGCSHRTAFPRTARLLTASDYSAVFGKNKRLSDRYWTILVYRNETAQTRIGLAVAKKRAKRAVDRNRLKRIVRESFRHSKEKLTGTDIVVMNRDDTVKASNFELRDSLARLFEKVSTQRCS